MRDARLVNSDIGANTTAESRISVGGKSSGLTVTACVIGFMWMNTCVTIHALIVELPILSCSNSIMSLG